MKKQAHYYFGYDLPNIQLVQEHVQEFYREGTYTMSFGCGEDVMNSLAIRRGEDEILDDLIECCDGAGAFEE